MVPLQSAALYRQARALALSSPSNPKKLVLLHTAVALGGSLLITALNYILNLQIADTGGLAGLPLRTVLSTVQSVLELGMVVALPFWEIGLLFAALNWTAGEQAAPRDFLQGFRRIGAVLGLRLLQGGLFFAIGFAIFNLCSTLFMLTPLAQPLTELLEPLMQPSLTGNPADLLTPELLAQAAKICLPLFAAFGVLFAAVAIPLWYRLRFAKFAVMDGAGALTGMLQSVKRTQGRGFALFRLDLSFWWFYLLQILCVAVSYGDSLLSMAGIVLPISENAAFFLFYALGAVCQGLLLWQYQGQVLTTYCLAYTQLSEKPATTPPPKVPWVE